VCSSHFQCLLLPTCRSAGDFLTPCMRELYLPCFIFFKNSNFFQMWWLLFLSMTYSWQGNQLTPTSYHTSIVCVISFHCIYALWIPLPIYKYKGPPLWLLDPSGHAASCLRSKMSPTSRPHRCINCVRGTLPSIDAEC
jgi:hypothetical protein